MGWLVEASWLASFGLTKHRGPPAIAGLTQPAVRSRTASLQYLLQRIPFREFPSGGRAPPRGWLVEASWLASFGLTKHRGPPAIAGLTQPAVRSRTASLQYLLQRIPFREFPSGGRAPPRPSPLPRAAGLFRTWGAALRCPA